MGEFRAPGTGAVSRPSKQSDARDDLDLEFWRWKTVEEGPGPAPKAARKQSTAAQKKLFRGGVDGSWRIESGFPWPSRKVYLLG